MKLEKCEKIYTSVVVLGELMYGAHKSQLKDINRDKYLNFCLSFPVLNITKDVSLVYGKLKAELQTVGNIVPENDMWIAATALANNMTVVTQDKHFGHIPGLNVIKI